jgi:rhamnosyltransferase
LNVLRVGHEFACVILYEDDKKEKLKYMMKGLLHAVINKLGVAK